MRRASHGSERLEQVAIAGLSKIDGETKVGRRDDNRASTRVDIRESTFRIRDQLNVKHKRVNPS